MFSLGYPFMADQFEFLFKNISKHIELNTRDETLIRACFQSKQFSAKQIIQYAGEPCRNFYFVNSGILRAYCIDSKGKEATIMFAMNDWWITDMFCFVNQLPAMMFIETLKESEVLCIQHLQLEQLLKQIPDFERFFRILMQNAYTREQLRSIENLTLTAEQRYDIFLEKYPKVTPLITQKQLATYLGISPEFLSVIRKNKSKK